MASTAAAAATGAVGAGDGAGAVVDSAAASASAAPSSARAATAGAAATAVSLHHEHQRLQMCGIHAVNAVLQSEYGPHYTSSEFDEIAHTFDPPRLFHFNAHKSSLGMGNYDANILLFALHQRGLECKWHDQRKKVVGTLDPAGLVAVIINIPPRGFFGSLFDSRHWVTLRNVGGVWYDLDSLKSKPTVIGGDADLLTRVQAEIDGGATALCVRRAPPSAEGGSVASCGGAASVAGSDGGCAAASSAAVVAGSAP